MRFTANYNKLKYEGIKLTVDTKKQAIKIVDSAKILTSSDPIQWRYGIHKAVSLFDRVSHADDWIPSRGRSLDTWSIDESGFDIFKQPERFNKLLEIIGDEYDVITCTPTHFKSNHDFYDAICQNIKCELILTEKFLCSTISDVEYYVDYDALAADMGEDEIFELQCSLWRDTYNLSSDEYEHILFNGSNVELRYRKYLQHKVSENYNYCDLLDVIENKRLLILDDTLLADGRFSALELSINTQLLFEMYRPKRAIIATLFAPLRRKQEPIDISFDSLQAKITESTLEEFDPECYEEDELGYLTYTATKIDKNDNVF